MKQQEKSRNQFVLAVVIIGTGVLLAFGPLREYLWSTPERPFSERIGMLLAVGCAYIAGCLVTRTIDQTFANVFEKAPFSEIGDHGQDDGYFSWVDAVLGTMAYTIFLGRSLIVIAMVLGAGWCFARVLETGL